MLNYYRNLRHQFALFSRLHETISFLQLKKWFNQAKIFCARLTSEDMETAYNTFNSVRIDYDTFEKFLEKLATQRKTFASELKFKLVNCGIPDVAKMSLPILIRDRNNERKMDEMKERTEKEARKKITRRIKFTTIQQERREGREKIKDKTIQIMNGKKKREENGKIELYDKLIGDDYISWEFIPCRRNEIL